MGISSEYHWNIMARNLLDIKSATICISKLQMNRRIWKVFKFQSLLSNPTNSKKKSPNQRQKIKYRRSYRKHHTFVKKNECKWCMCTGVWQELQSGYRYLAPTADLMYNDWKIMSVPYMSPIAGVFKGVDLNFLLAMCCTTLTTVQVNG